MKLRIYKKRCRKFFGKKNVEFKRYNGSLWMRHGVSKRLNGEFSYINNEAIQ
jgi:hypothetical protein